MWRPIMFYARDVARTRHGTCYTKDSLSFDTKKINNVGKGHRERSVLCSKTVNIIVLCSKGLLLSKSDKITLRRLHPALGQATLGKLICTKC